jgi:3-phosphoinositide dependent protein kinase-1
VQKCGCGLFYPQPQGGATARFIAAEIVKALADLRQNEVIHRDLKPGNIMLDQDYHVKLIDFATAKTLNSDFGLSESFPPIDEEDF